MLSTALITQSTGVATLEEWAKLDLSTPSSHVLRVTRVRYDDNKDPHAVEEIVLAQERFRDLATTGGDVSDIVELAQRHGLSLGRVTERISLVPATKAVASQLQIAFGADVLKVNRIVETVNDEPVEWRVTFSKI
jgi:GntR family transcriptional regulator